MKSIAIYYRVSTDRQELSSQKNAVEHWLESLSEEKKPKKVLIYEDHGLSGTNSERPAYRKMLEEATKGRFDTLVVYRLDRFSRNASEAIREILNLDQLGVAFVSVTQAVLNLGHENPFRRTMLAAFAEIAEIERQTIVSRVKAGLEAAKARGVKLGAPSKINSEVEQQIIELRAEGNSLRAIARKLELSYGAVQKVVTQSESTC